MDAFHLADLLGTAADDDPYFEFLRYDAMSLGIYRLPAGGDDPQEPHDEDEVYVVLDGRATLEVAGEATPVASGSVVYVEQGTDHRFVDIEEDLVTLVAFAPAEGSLAGRVRG